jgi:hypothetical protein
MSAAWKITAVVGVITMSSAFAQQNQSGYDVGCSF